AVHDLYLAPRAHAYERFQPRQRIECVATYEVRCVLDRPALAAVLVTPVRLALRHAGEVEIEVRGEARGARRAREHDAQHVSMLVVGDERAEAKQLVRSGRRVPLAHVRRCAPRTAVPRFEARECIAYFVLEVEEVVALRLHPHQQAVEGGDVDTGRVEAALERPHERRTGTRKRIEHAIAGSQAGTEGLLYE